MEMQARWVSIAASLLLVGVAPVRSAEPYDHYKVGQDDGKLVVDTYQFYRQWNADYATNPDPYGAAYYEFIETFTGQWNRIEPGPRLIEDANYHFPGQVNVDYSIYLQRVYATPGLQVFDGLTPIFEDDGDSFWATDPNLEEPLHIHFRYLVDDNPTESYSVMLRFWDEVYDPNDPNAGGYAPSRPFVVPFGAEPNYYALSVTVKREGYGEVVFDPEPPMRIIPAQGYDPNAEPNDPPAYPLGVPVTLTAVPDETRRFNFWRIYDPNHPGDANYTTDDSNTSITLVMDADWQVEAKFKCGSSADPVLPPMLVAMSLILLALRRIAGIGA
jgi:hypothetical protein